MTAVSFSRRSPPRKSDVRFLQRAGDPLSILPVSKSRYLVMYELNVSSARRSARTLNNATPCQRNRVAQPPIDPRSKSRGGGTRGCLHKPRCRPRVETGRCLSLSLSLCVSACSGPPSCDRIRKRNDPSSPRGLSSREG